MTSQDTLQLLFIVGMSALRLPAVCPRGLIHCQTIHPRSGSLRDLIREFQTAKRVLPTILTHEATKTLPLLLFFPSVAASQLPGDQHSLSSL